MNEGQKTELFYLFLGATLLEYRTKADLSLDQLAAKSESGLSRSSLSLIENGKQQINGFQLFDLSRVLRFSVDDLFKTIEEKMATEQYPDLKNIL